MRARVRLGRGLGVEDDLHRPVRSRRSTNTRPPWSRRRCTQPATRTCVADPRGAQTRRTRCRGSGSAAAPACRRPSAGTGEQLLPQAGERDLLLLAARMSRTAAAARSHSSGPTITTHGAPRRSAWFIWPLRQRRRGPSSPRRPPRAAPTSARKTRGARLRLGHDEHELRAVAAARPPPRRPRRARRPAPARSAPGRSPSRRPASASPPSCSIRPVVAPAAADAALRAERVGAELEHRARVVVEPAHQPRVELVVDRRRRRAAAAPRRSARASASESRSIIFGAASVTATISGASQSKARIGLISIRARCSASNTSWRSRKSRSSRAYSARDVRVADAGQVQPHAGSPSRAYRCASRSISSASTAGSSEPIVSAPIWLCWR